MNAISATYGVPSLNLAAIATTSVGAVVTSPRVRVLFLPYTRARVLTYSIPPLAQHHHGDLEPIKEREHKSQYILDIERVRDGSETRTTLMIKNIPNKYTQKMLLAAVDDNHRGQYDFFYLPIDFKVPPLQLFRRRCDDCTHLSLSLSLSLSRVSLD